MGVRNRSKKFPLAASLSPLVSWITSSFEIPLILMILAMTALHWSSLPVAESHLGDSETTSMRGSTGRKATATAWAWRPVSERRIRIPEVSHQLKVESIR